MKQGGERIDIGLGSCPAGDETDSGLVFTSRSPQLERNVLKQSIHHIIGKNEELLIGRRIDSRLVAFLLENMANAHCHGISLTRDTTIEIICEQCTELYSQQASLGKQSSMLLDQGEEMRQRCSSNWTALIVESVDTRDLKSLGPKGRAGSTPLGVLSRL